MGVSRQMPRGLEEEPRRVATEVQMPSVGRQVHYVAYGTPGGEFPAGVCRAWHWPERF